MIALGLVDSNLEKKQKKIKTIFKIINSVRFQNEKIKLKNFENYKNMINLNSYFISKQKKSKENGKENTTKLKKNKFLIF